MSDKPQPPEKPLPKDSYEPVTKLTISENGRAVTYDCIAFHEEGEFTNHLNGENYHQKTIRVVLRRECDGKD
jgi:hypothetical protein